LSWGEGGAKSGTFVKGEEKGDSSYKSLGDMSWKSRENHNRGGPTKGETAVDNLEKKKCWCPKERKKATNKGERYHRIHREESQGRGESRDIL